MPKAGMLFLGLHCGQGRNKNVVVHMFKTIESEVLLPIYIYTQNCMFVRNSTNKIRVALKINHDGSSWQNNKIVHCNHFTCA